MKFASNAILLGILLFGGENALEAQLIVAHRGASHDAPENTCAAFLLAWQQQADAIEGDFYLTGDSQIACLHDGTTERTSNKTENLTIADSTLAQLQGVDVGSWKGRGFADQRIPSLQEVLAVVPVEKKIFIEIKCGPEIVPFLHRVLAASAHPPEQTRIICFKEAVIDAVKKELPEIEAYWLVSFQKVKRTNEWRPAPSEVIARAQMVGADGVDLEANASVVDASFISACHDAGLSVHVWTVNNPDAAMRFHKLGVDSITTNRPGLLRETLFPASRSNRQPAARRASPRAQRPRGVNRTGDDE